MRFATALAALTVSTLVSLPALADCVPGTGLCASVGAGLPGVQAGGQVVIGIPPFFGPGPAAPQAAPPPPPRPSYAPPPSYGSYGYAPPPPYGAPYGGYPSGPRPMMARPDFAGSPFGLDLHVEGAGFGGDRSGNSYGLGGAGVALKYKATPHLALELGLDVVGGHDWSGDKRVEVAGHFGGQIVFNPRSRLQVYLPLGMVVDHATTPGSTTSDNGASANGLTYDHVGGYAGLGLELFVTRHFSLHADARGVLREKVGGSPGAEFTDPTTGRTTNTSGGVLGQGGVTFYF